MKVNLEDTDLKESINLLLERTAKIDLLEGIATELSGITVRLTTIEQRLDKVESDQQFVKDQYKKISTANDDIIS